MTRTAAAEFPVSLQFIPALMTLVRTGVPTLGLVAVVVLTLLAGRIYCSSICPLGTLQDVVIALSRRTRGPRKYKFRKAFTLVHYSVLAVLTLGAVAGSLVLVDLLDPYSFFGRIAYVLARPGAVGANNAIAWVFERLHLYLVYAVPFHSVSSGALVLTLSMLGLVVWMSYYHGRMFCNLLCPAGALLGLLSRVSLFKLDFNNEECRDCSLCEKLCKAECIDYKKRVLDSSRCVSCFNCIDACPAVGVHYRFRYSAKKDLPPPPDAKRTVNAKRREMLRQSATLAAVAASATAARAFSAPAASAHPYTVRGIVTPPGSESAERFTGACTACYLCVSACPSQVIVPSFLDYGVRGILQPKMDYSIAYCAYECTACTSVCPTGALMPLPLQQKKETQLGRAKFIKEDCIVITKKTDCGACSEHCPTKAVQMVKTDGLFLPKMTEELCVGCGACEHACPVKPNKAIFVQASAVHGRAQKPVQKKVEEKKAVPEEFPF
ncbi:MAG: 4Fe-4S dicluster domain-containing protein [Acidobacteriota bacterium]